MESTHNKSQIYFFLFLLVIVGIIMFYILRPFLAPLILALALAVIFRPVYRKIQKNIVKGPGFAALLTVILILLVVFVPLLFLGGLLFNEAQHLYLSLTSNGGGINTITNAGQSLEHYLQRFSPDITIDIARYAQIGLQWTISHLDAFFSGFLRIALGLFIMIIALFYLLRDGTALRRKFITLSPLSNQYDEEIMEKIKAAIDSVIRGSVVLAIVQGVLAALGGWIFGLPNPLIWGACTTIASFIPGIGTSLVMIPAVIYLFILRYTGGAIGLLIWQLVIVGLIDNILGPFLVGRGIKVHSFFILLSVLGGLAFFGPIGFLLGPIMLALMFALLDIYPLILK